MRKVSPSCRASVSWQFLLLFALLRDQRFAAAEDVTECSNPKLCPATQAKGNAADSWMARREDALQGLWGDEEPEAPPSDAAAELRSLQQAIETAKVWKVELDHIVALASGAKAQWEISTLRGDPGVLLSSWPSSNLI